LPNPTLIYGETGTGKELFAQSMIDYSQVPKNKVVIQNCAAVPENLMESILFGTVKGVYTGAENMKGLFEQADGGVLFLDELNSIPYGVQSKLLRVLQDGTFRPLGSNRDKHVNVKVIAAMNIDPVEAMEKNIIRSDLFYRLSGGLISLLPLRERKEDIKLFIDYYIRAFSATYNKNVEAISLEAERIFLEYPWPGNVRELRNTIESMIVTLKDGNTISEKEIPLYIKERMKLQLDNSQKEKRPSDNGGENWTQEFEGDEDGVINYHEIMETVEKKLIEKAIAKSGGNIKEAGRLLGIPRETLRYRIKKLGMEEE
ncbi:MAG: sigma 54-interacting transcriptional regulator, partial [Firmicutes bacterium]|nr:sigma 54-interacting transcriptional regulator [Bacillota bacterium]